MKKILFIDRDGTIIKEPKDKQIDSFEKLEFINNVISNLSKIVKKLEYELVMVTNQDGLGTKSFPEKKFWNVHNKMLSILKSENIIFSDIAIDRSFKHQQLATRKPNIGMLYKYINHNYDLKNSFVIGDRETDIELAQNLGTKSIYLSHINNKYATFTTNCWNKIYEFLTKKIRKVLLHRKTNETDINIELNLDGHGEHKINTGLFFFDHMLEQISQHSNIDLIIEVKKNDLDKDEHHIIEDIAITLGECFLQALGSKKGIERYGFLLPMDDSLAQVAIDFSGRPYLIWETTFQREKIGDMPTEMFYHFFKSFADHSRSTINIKAEGINEHHKIEAIFKAFAKSIKIACQKTNNYSIPSTKGLI